MKKYGLFIGIILLAFNCMAQERITFEEVTVKAPAYGGEVEVELNKNVLASPISQYLSYYLTEQAETNLIDYAEGTVIVDFTVFKDGNIDNFMVKNSVSNRNDNAVISALKSTNGDWIGGEKDGQSVDMQKRIVVKFSDEKSPSLQAQSQYFYKKGLKKFFAAEDLKDNLFISREKKDKITKRKLHSALYQFNRATVMTPNETSVIYWQMKTYQSLGDVEMQNQMQNKYMDLVFLYTDNYADFIAYNY